MSERVDLVKREQLREIGIEEEVIDKVMAFYGQSTNALKERAENAESDKGALESETKDLQGQIKDRDNQLDGLKAMSGNSKELNDEIERLKEENKTAEKEAEDRLNSYKVESAIKLALTKAKVKNEVAGMALVNKEAIELDKDGNVKGLDEQMKTLVEENPYLFDDGKIIGTPPGGEGKPPEVSVGEEMANLFNNSNQSELTF